MSYRSIKRVLGESSLERKIRIWFGICLLLLIAGSFFWVNRITENLIRSNTRDKARELMSSFILKTHLQNVQSDIVREELFQSLAEVVHQAVYEADALVANSTHIRVNSNPIDVTGTNEQSIVERLTGQAAEYQSKENRRNAFRTSEDVLRTEESYANLTKELFWDDFEANEYYFYSPVIFSASCLECHQTESLNPVENATFSSTIQAAVKANDREEEQNLLHRELQKAPGFVLRIKLPYREVKSAVNKSRAILMAVAIVTAFLAMVALYLIVRYVIVKPLKHLRDVTEEVSHGRMDVRAELYTGDEFEELSRSFNRMLRHLLDSQMALQSANEDLDRKVDEQAQMNLKLYEMNQVNREFLTNMSHELRTPLNSIIGFSEILEAAKGLDEKKVRFASNIRKSGRLLLDLINDILDLAKLETGKSEVHPTEFPIDQLIGELCDMVRGLAESKNIQLIACVDESLPTVYQDRVKLRQVLTNLLSNAIKFTPEGGRINVTAKKENEKLVLTVHDTGVGIAEADQEIIFEKFRQGPSALGRDSLTREFSGTGLGLSIVREICRLLDGSVELESQVGKGSTFTVTLPWNLEHLPQINSDISQSIDEITKQQRVDFARTNLAPKPPEPDDNESTADASDPETTSAQTTDGIASNDKSVNTPENSNSNDDVRDQSEPQPPTVADDAPPLSSQQINLP